MKVWIRDACGWTSDFGSSNGWLSIDLLWFARMGQSIGTAHDAAPLGAPYHRLPGVQSALDSICPTEAQPVQFDLHPDLRVPTSPVVPGLVDLVGSRVLRIRLEYCFLISPPWPTLPTADFEALAHQGWFEGLIIAPYTHSAVVIPAGSAAMGDPSDLQHANQMDWLWWDRKYTRSQNMKTASVGAPFVSTTLVFSDIDTRNGRRIEQLGNSLYWHIKPSGNPPPPATPQQGTTFNGGVASWSVLLDVPSMG